jgi:hypothetical protein
MIFRTYSQTLSQASKTMAAGILMVGLMLISLGVLIAAFPKVFAYVVAGVLVAAGLGIAAVSLKIFLMHRGLTRKDSGQDDMRSPNIQVRPPDAF